MMVNSRCLFYYTTYLHIVSSHNSKVTEVTEQPVLRWSNNQTKCIMRLKKNILNFTAIKLIVNIYIKKLGRIVANCNIIYYYYVSFKI